MTISRTLSDVAKIALPATNTGISVAAIAMAFVAFIVNRWRATAWRHPTLVVSGGSRIRQIVERCPRLHKPFRPPLLAFHTFAQLALHAFFHENKRADTGKHARFNREIRKLDDGGEVGFDWLDDSSFNNKDVTPPPPPLPDTAPLLVCLHTITGGSHDFAGAAMLARTRGFRVVVFLRRGHIDRPLATPRFNLLGCVHDLHAQLVHVRSQYPQASHVACLSSSAGTGLSVRYCGEKGDACLIDALVCTCPGYDTTEGGAFARMQPMLGSYLLRGVRKLFLEPNVSILKDVKGFQACHEDVDNMADFQRNAYQLEGFDSLESYHDATNPMGVASDISVPTLVINAEDDPVCAKSNVMDHVHLFSSEDNNANRALALTRWGAHCCYFEGDWLLPRGYRWCDEVAVEFLLESCRTTNLPPREGVAREQQHPVSSSVL